MESNVQNIEESANIDKEIAITTISEYIQLVCNKNFEIYKHYVFNSNELLFRGQSDKNYQLLPSIARDHKHTTSDSIFNEERNLIELAKFRMPDIFHKDLSPIELLALLQHHGIPTRLLDVTENALVALYFACCGNNDRDGEVIVFKRLNIDVANYPIVNAIADSYRFSNTTWTQLSSFYESVKIQPYFLEQRHDLEVCHDDNKAGARWIKDCCNKIMYIYAPIRSLRQQVQKGRYILFPNHINEHGIFEEGCFEHKISEIPKSHKDIFLRIIIPKEIKIRMLIDLKALGISKASLFCDNIDTVCEGIVGEVKKGTLRGNWIGKML